MSDLLAPLLADGILDEVVARLKSGKEADLWLVRQGAEIVAAKVYKPRLTRSFKNDAAYREGRQVRNSRTQRAMDRGTRFGQAAAEEAWKSKEADALYTLHAAGVRVPKPVLFHEGVLLMEVVVDATGSPAPRLIDTAISREQAGAFYADLRSQAVRMLTCDLIHGDLSPFNVLMGASGPVIIDFPQVIGAAHNNQAERFFLRDLENLRSHFAALDPSLRGASGDGQEIWRAYVRRELTPEFVPSGKRLQEHSRQEHSRQEHSRQDHSRQDHSRQDHSRQDHSRQEHSRQEHPHQDHPRQDHPRQDHPRQDHPRQDHPRQEHPRQEHPRQEHPRQEHPRQDHPRQDHPRQDRSRQNHPQQEHPRQDYAPNSPKPPATTATRPNRPPSPQGRPAPELQQQQRRPPDRARRGPPTPEVVRVARLPSRPTTAAPSFAQGQQPQAAKPGASPSHGPPAGPSNRRGDGRFNRRRSS